MLQVPAPSYDGLPFPLVGAATMPASLLHAPTSDLLHPHVLLAEPEAARQLAARLGLDHIQQMAAYQASKILAGLLVVSVCVCVCDL